MKSFILTALLLTSFTASATEIKIYSTWANWGQIDFMTFDINSSLNRAWVTMELDSSPSDPDSEPEELRIKVDGLTYDSETKEIIFTNENDIQTVCANMKTRGRGIFRNTRLRKTGNCKFKKSYEIRTRDDGYHVTKKRYQVITFIVND